MSPRRSSPAGAALSAPAATIPLKNSRRSMSSDMKRRYANGAPKVWLPVCVMMRITPNQHQYRPDCAVTTPELQAAEPKLKQRHHGSHLRPARTRGVPVETGLGLIHQAVLVDFDVGKRRCRPHLIDQAFVYREIRTPHFDPRRRIRIVLINSRDLVIVGHNSRLLFRREIGHARIALQLVIHVSNIAITGRDLTTGIVIDRVRDVAGSARLVLPHMRDLMHQNGLVIALKAPAVWYADLPGKRCGRVQNGGFHDPNPRGIHATLENILNGVE